MALTDFITAANTLGFGKKYNFQVTDITGLPDSIKLDESYLLYVESFVLPSRKTNTTTVPYKAFDFNVPTNTSFVNSASWRVTFFSDENLLIKELFEKWCDMLYNPIYNYSDSSLYGDPTYTKPFGDCNLQLDLKNDNNDTVKTITLYGVFPVLVEGIEYNVGDAGDTVARLPITLAYQYFD